MPTNRVSSEIQSVKQRFSIIGNSPQLINAIERALQVAPIDLSVLIMGESGAGKEFFPQIIHANSARKHNKYIAVNCGAIPEGTIDSELFGHEKGAFTGAISDRKGYFEEANGGTIFLDEVAELPLTTQARLLRVLESGEYLRVGSSEVKKTNIRVVAATNKDMAKAVKEGKFREDLFYRLSTVQINIPPLRERGDDIWLLTRKFSHDFADNYRTPVVEYDEDARRALLHYRWPGNVRQLKNVVEQIALFEAGKTLSRDEVMHYLPYTADELKPVVAGKESQFDYAHDRSLLFGLMIQLQEEIKNIKAALKNGTQLVHFNSDIEEIKREAKPLVKLPSIKAPSIRPVDFNEQKHLEVAPVSGTDYDDVKETPMIAEEVKPIKTLEDTERETITRALDRNCGRRKKTAEELNISERTLYRKIKEYGLELRNQKSSK